MHHNSNLFILRHGVNMSYNISNRNLLELPRVPEGTVELICARNNLTEIDGSLLPESLQVLKCQGNQITKIINLPDNLERLICHHNNLTSLDGLPPSLMALICNNNQLTELDNLPKSLTYLNCAFNKIFYLDNLPQTRASWDFLDCSHNYLTSIDLKMSAMTQLNCSYNFIQTLDHLLPESLVKLWCGHNPIKQHNDLPCNLKFISCSSNLLTTIDGFPDNIEYIFCDGNYIKIIDQVPSKLKQLRCSGNHVLHRLSNLPDTLTTLDITQNHYVELDTVPPKLTNLICSQGCWLIDRMNNNCKIIQRHNSANQHDIVIATMGRVASCSMLSALKQPQFSGVSVVHTHSLAHIKSYIKSSNTIWLVPLRDDPIARNLSWYSLLYCVRGPQTGNVILDIRPRSEQGKGPFFVGRTKDSVASNTSIMYYEEQLNNMFNLHLDFNSRDELVRLFRDKFPHTDCWKFIEILWKDVFKLPWPPQLAQDKPSHYHEFRAFNNDIVIMYTIDQAKHALARVKQLKSIKTSCTPKPFPHKGPKVTFTDEEYQWMKDHVKLPAKTIDSILNHPIPQMISTLEELKTIRDRWQE